MKVLNIGSLNLDFVYSVDHILAPGETESSESRNVYLGGKGMNQSCALAKAGVAVYHCGMIGQDGEIFLDACKKYGVNYDLIRTVEGPSGHAVIQIDKHGQNSILLFGGANQQLTECFVDEVLSQFSAGDILLLQNEVNLLPYIVDKAFEKGLTIALNPSPFNDKLNAVDLQKIRIFILNEVEGFQITGEKEPDTILQKMQILFPDAQIMLTLGKNGAVYTYRDHKLFQPAFPVKAVDTTAAGDTFTGYFLAGLTEKLPIEQTLRMSAMASAIAVTREGAVPSIPERAEVIKALHNEKK